MMAIRSSIWKLLFDSLMTPHACRTPDPMRPTVRTLFPFKNLLGSSKSFPSLLHRQEYFQCINPPSKFFHPPIIFTGNTADALPRVLFRLHLSSFFFETPPGSRSPSWLGMSQGFLSWLGVLFSEDETAFSEGNDCFCFCWDREDGTKDEERTIFDEDDDGGGVDGSSFSRSAFSFLIFCILFQDGSWSSESETVCVLSHIMFRELKFRCLDIPLPTACHFPFPLLDKVVSGKAGPSKDITSSFPKADSGCRRSGIWNGGHRVIFVGVGLSRKAPDDRLAILPVCCLFTCHNDR